MVKPARILRLVLTAVVMLGILAACTDDDSDDAGGTDGGNVEADGGTDAGGSDVVAEADAVVADAKGDQPFPELPAAPTPATDQKLVIISVDQRLEGIVREVDGMVSAAEHLGWETIVVDGQSSPDAMNAGVERALNENATGLVLVSFPSSLVQAALEDVRARDIPIVSVTSGSQVGEDGVDAEVGSAEFNRLMGEMQGWYAVSDSEGTAKAVVFNDTAFVTAPPIADGAIAILDRCDGCEVLEKIDFISADVTTALPEAVRSALVNHPDATYVLVPYDAAALFAAEGIRSAQSDAKLLSTGGNTANLDLIRQGDVQVMTSAQPLEYYGYLAIDAMVRLLAGEEVPPFESPVKILDDSNLPPEGEPWRGDSDFEAYFEQLWGE